MPVTIGFNHVATMTADLDRLIRFYAEAFGGEVTFENGRRRCGDRRDPATR